MKINFYVKIFFAFVLFSIILLSFSSFAFNNFYQSYSQGQNYKTASKYLDYQENFYKNFLFVYQSKINLISELFKENKYEQIDNLINENKDLSYLRITNLKGEEVLRFDKINNKIETKNLDTIYAKDYYKYIRVLKENENLNFINEDYKDLDILTSIYRLKDNFLILDINLDRLLLQFVEDKNLIYYLDKINFRNDYPLAFEKLRSENEYLEDYLLFRKIKLNSDESIYLIYDLTFSVEKRYIVKYFESLLILALCLAIVLSLLFSKPLANMNKKVEEKNKELDLNIKQNYIEINQNQKIIDEYILSIKYSFDLTILEISTALCEKSGYSKEELIGHPINKLFKQLKAFELEKLQKNRRVHFNEFKTYKKDNSIFHLNMVVEPNKDNTRTIIANDISDKKKIEELYHDLNHQIGQYDAILENVDSGIALIDLEGKFVKVNHSFAKLLKYKEKDLLNLTCLDLVHESSSEILKKLLKEAKDLGAISKIEEIFVDKNGENIHLELSLNLLSDKNHFVFVINSLEDKRKLQELNQSLESKVKEEVEKNIQKDKIHQQEQIKNAKLTSIGSLAAGIAHEINTPLTYIKGNLEMMEFDIEDLEDSKIKEQMKYDTLKMKEGVNRIANIVESMREMSQSTKEVKEETNIYATLVTALTMAYNKSKQICKIYLNDKEFDINSINKNEFIFNSVIQKQRIEQVWIIIVNNALDELIKIDDYEKRSLKINIILENENIIVRFKDSAGGIKKEIIDDIFEPFMSTKEHGGMGVGLNIAKKIVEEQNGEIKAYNEDVGAVFEVKLKIFEDESNT